MVAHAYRRGCLLRTLSHRLLYPGWLDTPETIFSTRGGAAYPSSPLSAPRATMTRNDGGCVGWEGSVEASWGRAEQP